MAGNGKRSLEEIFEEHLAVTREGFAQMRVEMNEFRGELRDLRKDMNEGFRAIRTEMIGGLAQVRKEMNAGFAKTPWDAHEERITALEADVAKLKAG